MTEQPTNPPELKVVEVSDDVAFDKLRQRHELEATTINITRGVAYAPVFTEHELLPKELIHFCHDQQKRNLLALVVPDLIEPLSLDCMIKQIVSDIDEFMSSDMRDALRQKPMAFMTWFDTEHPGSMRITQFFPPGFHQLMWKEAGRLTQVWNNRFPVNFQ